MKSCYAYVTKHARAIPERGYLTKTAWLPTKERYAKCMEGPDRENTQIQVCI